MPGVIRKRLAPARVWTWLISAKPTRRIASWALLGMLVLSASFGLLTALLVVDVVQLSLRGRRLVVLVPLVIAAGIAHAVGSGNGRMAARAESAGQRLDGARNNLGP